MTFDITSEKLSERVDLVHEALASISTRAQLVAYAALNLADVGTVITADGLTYRYTGGAGIGDLPGWEPNNDIFARHFGAKEDYDQATAAGTDDLAAITAAMAYAAAEWKPGVSGGGKVWITFRSLVSAPLVLPVGVSLAPVAAVSSTGDGQTAGSTYPITYNEGSGIVGSHLVGPVILCGADDTGVGALTIGGTAARRAAAISTGGQNRNCGILVETADTASANIRRITLNGPLIKDQPAEGYVVCGDVTNFIDNGTHVLNVGSHGFAIDNGSLVGRTNKARPGIFSINQWRGNNLGGHLWAIGHPSSGSDVPYRGDLNNCEGFRSGNVPALRYKDAGTYVFAEQITFNNCAPSGTTGYSGSTIGATYAAYSAGRSVHYNNCRFINANKAMLVGTETGLGTGDLKVNGGHFSTTATAPDYAIDVTGVIRGLFVHGLTGDYNIAPVNVAAAQAINSDGYGEVIYTDPVTLDGVRAPWNLPIDTPVQHEWRVVGAAKLKLSASRTFSDSPFRLGLDLDMPIGMGTSALSVQGTDSPSTLTTMLRTSADSAAPAIRMGKQRSGFNFLSSGDDLASLIGAMPDNVSAMVDAGVVRVEADSASATYGRIVMETRGATGALVEAMRADSAQVVRAAKAAVKGLQSYRFTIADDAAATIAMTGTSVTGIIQVSGNVNAAGAADVHFRCGTSAFMTLRLSSGVTVGVGTTALTGTTGTDGQLNLATTTGGLLYIENRTGASRTYVVTLTSIDFANGEFA